jgi:AAA domain
VHSYRICGLSVVSDIVLPGLIAGQSESAPEVTIRRGSVPEALPEPTAIGPTWQIAGKQFLLGVPNVARFLLNNGHEIVFAPDSEASAEDVPIFILGTVFGILLHQREQIVLHASAVEVDGKAVVFCGPSGAGKSTLAAALAQKDYRVITDDICAISLSRDRDPIVHPDGRQLKLWAQAIKQLELEEKCCKRVRPCLEKFYVEPSNVASQPLPLGGVYVLWEVRPHDDFGIERFNIVDATLLLRDHAYRPLLVRLQQKQHYFAAAAQIINRCGIFRLPRSRNFAALSQLVSGLQQHWRDIGLAEQAV